MNTIVIGHLELKGRYESACRVFEPSGISPCQNTCGGGGLKHTLLNMNPNRLFNIYGENRGTGFAGNVWDIDMISPTITTCQGARSDDFSL